MNLPPLQPCPTTLDEIDSSKKEKWSWLGWLGAVLVILGYYLNANMCVLSWLVWMVGNSLVAWYSWHKEAYPTAVMSVVILIMNIYGWISWS
jgi:hypothetical protein